MSDLKNDIIEDLFQAIDTIVADRIKQNNYTYNINQISNFQQLESQLKEKVTTKELEITKSVLYKGKDLVVGYSKLLNPKWLVNLFSEKNIIASYSKSDFYLSQYYASGVFNYSQPYYLVLPYPMNPDTLILTGSSNNMNNGFTFITDVHVENNVGVSFRVASQHYFNSNEPFSLQLQLMGEVADIPSNPPSNFGSIADLSSPSYSPIAIAKTYFEKDRNKKFKYGANWLYSGNDSTINSPSRRVRDTNGRCYGECDTFGTLILRGLRYNDSPYNMKDSNNNYILEYEEDDLPANLHGFAWVNRINKFLIGKTTPKGDGTNIVPDDTYPAYKYYHRNLYYASDIAWGFWYNQAIFSDINKVQSGDVAFWTRPSTNTHYFGNVTHVAIISKESDGLYAYEIGGATEQYPTLRKIKLTEKNYMPAYFGRIQFKAN